MNSFGVGGVNGHALLKPNYKKPDKNLSKIVDKIPRLINICCRNEETLNAFYSFIENNPNKITQDFLALLSDVMKIKPSLNSAGFPYRGEKFLLPFILSIFIYFPFCKFKKIYSENLFRQKIYF